MGNHHRMKIFNIPIHDLEVNMKSLLTRLVMTRTGELKPATGGRHSLLVPRAPQGCSSGAERSGLSRLPHSSRACIQPPWDTAGAAVVALQEPLTRHLLSPSPQHPAPAWCQPPPRLQIRARRFLEQCNRRKACH